MEDHTALTWIVRGALGLVVLATAHCSDGSTGETRTTAPSVHRPSALSCDPTRSAGTNRDAGPAPDSGAADASSPTGQSFTCKSDAECTEGRNGRCISSRLTTCTYDACLSDAECAADEVCACASSSAGAGDYARPEHRCVKSQCKVDGDCSSGFCSPSRSSTCVNMSGTIGYFCHTPNDACRNDSDCNDTTQGEGACVWQPTAGRWACTYGRCVG